MIPNRFVVQIPRQANEKSAGNHLDLKGIYRRPLRLMQFVRVGGGGDDDAAGLTEAVDHAVLAAVPMNVGFAHGRDEEHLIVRRRCRSRTVR